MHVIYFQNYLPTYLIPRTPSLRFITVDGGWGMWGAWSTCSSTCGVGQRDRIRLCDNPLPQYGGSICFSTDSVNPTMDETGIIKEIESKDCILHHCPGIVHLIRHNFSMFIYLILKQCVLL